MIETTTKLTLSVAHELARDLRGSIQAQHLLACESGKSLAELILLDLITQAAALENRIARVMEAMK